MINLFRKRCNKQIPVKPSEIVLPEGQYMEYNGVRVHWFIGDFNDRAGFWEAWGSCYDSAGKLRPYQLFGLYDQGRGRSGIQKKKNPRRLFNILVLNDPNNIYYHEETYNRLTV